MPFSGPPPAPATGGHVHGDGHSHGPGDHEAHCHAAVATCAETRIGGAAPVTVLLETVVLLLGGGAWLAVAPAVAGRLRGAALARLDPPPRMLLPVAHP